MGVFNNHLLFNLGSWGYDLLTDQDIWRQQIAEVLDYVDEAAIGRVLDLGCGPGVSAFVLAERLPHADVVGIDIAEKMVGRARRHHRRDFGHLGNVDFGIGDATAIGFADDSMDLVVGHSFLYLVPDRHAVLREVRRVLGPGGTMVLMEPNGDGSFRDAASTGFGQPSAEFGVVAVALFHTSMLLWRLVSGDVGRLDPADVQRWMLDAGFDDARVHPTLGGLGMHCVGRVD